MTTENKAIDDLMKPRYKVIADYPDNEFSVGEILPDEVVSNEEDEILKYPHLFKKLEWWEERRESEMPEYVKIFDVVERFDKFKSRWESFLAITKKDFTPATEVEYLNQKQQGHD